MEGKRAPHVGEAWLPGHMTAGLHVEDVCPCNCPVLVCRLGCGRASSHRIYLRRCCRCGCRLWGGIGQRVFGILYLSWCRGFERLDTLAKPVPCQHRSPREGTHDSAAEKPHSTTGGQGGHKALI